MKKVWATTFSVLLCASSVAFAGQNPATTDAAKQDVKKDQQIVKQEKADIQRDKAKLRADQKAGNAAAVAADKADLKRDQAALKRDQGDLKAAKHRKHHKKTTVGTTR